MVSSENKRNCIDSYMGMIIDNERNTGKKRKENIMETMALNGNKSFLFVFIQVKSLIKRNFDETTRISRRTEVSESVLKIIVRFVSVC